MRVLFGLLFAVLAAAFCMAGERDYSVEYTPARQLLIHEGEFFIVTEGGSVYRGVRIDEDKFQWRQINTP